MKIESFLPIFPGFYGTIFEPNEEPYIEDGKTYDDYEWDYHSYYQRVAKACVPVIEDMLRDLNITTDIKFQSLLQPKEYNFGNDSINVEYTISKRSLRVIKDYLMSHIEAFREFLRDNYTNCSGFISHYENYPEAWLNDLIHEHKFGAVLGFILNNENENVANDLYDGIVNNTYIDGYLKENN